MKAVDLRSDTVTQPTQAMRAAMMAAPLGDDVFGDDPSVNALQEKIAGNSALWIFPMCVLFVFLVHAAEYESWSLPTAIILMITGSIGKGITLLLLGTFVIALADNLLRPILVGRETRIPDYVVLLSTLGGLGLFGLSGFVAGPAIAALFITTWDMFAREYAPADRTTKPLKPEA